MFYNITVALIKVFAFVGYNCNDTFYRQFARAAFWPPMVYKVIFHFKQHDSSYKGSAHHKTFT